MSDSKKLYEITRDVLDKFGQDTIQTIKLANLLADFNAYADTPSAKIIIRDILNKGFGQKIYDIYVSDRSSLSIKLIDLVEDYSKESSYKLDQVSYVFDCLAYGLRCIDKVNDPFSNTFDPYAKSSENIGDILDEKIKGYKKQYLDLLDRLLVVPTDLLRQSSAYYTTESLNKLYAIEIKYKAVCLQVGNHELEWCSQQKKAVLDKHLAEKIRVVNDAIASATYQYQDILKHKITRTSNLFQTSKEFVSPDVEAELRALSNEIIELNKEIGQSYDNHLEKEKSDLIKKINNDRLDALKDFLSNEKHHFTSELKASLIYPGNFLVKKSAYLPPAAEKKLEPLKESIVNCCNELGIKYDNWCEDEIENVINANKVNLIEQVKHIITRLVPIVVIASLAVYFGGSYLSSRGEIKKFDHACDSARIIAHNGNLWEARRVGESARDGYDGSFMKECIKKSVQPFLDSCRLCYYAPCLAAVYQNDFAIVRSMLDSIPSDFCTKDSFMITQIRSSLLEAAEKHKTVIMNSIKNNRGKLSESERKTLKELSLILPDDYWLKMIMKKEGIK